MRRTITLRSVAVTAGIVTVLGLTAACGASDESGHEGHDTTDSASENAEFNDADVMFAQMMIPHHQQAVELATMAETQAADAEVKDIAAQIKGAQDPEIETMTGWLTDWGQSTDVPEGHEAMMSGMVSDEDMTKLADAEGAEFDKLFVTHMIDHHSGAIDMATEEQDNGSNADAIALAGEIIDAQNAEIEQLNTIADRL